MKRIVLLITAVALTCASASANAQCLLKKLGERAKNAAEQNIGNKVEKGVNDLLNGKVGKKEGSNNNQNNTQTQDAPQTAPASAGATAGVQKGQAATSTPQGKEVPGPVPNPYTVNDIPDNPFDVALGLPENDKTSERPSLVKPAAHVSYAAYHFPLTGPRSKEFWNAERRRMYSVSYDNSNGQERISKMLAIADSMAVYVINDASKVIVKMPISAVVAAQMQNVVSSETILDESDISSSQGRWCYKHDGATESVHDVAGHQRTEVGGETSFIDLETGITIQVDYGFAHEYTRNIHLGVFYPEIFDLPEDYRMVVQDFSAGAQRRDELEGRMKGAQEQMKGMNLENMSVEELMRRAK